MSLPGFDCYKVLGITRTATLSDIKTAYRDLAKQHHPDLSTKPESSERFIRIQTAYETLLNNRAEHDASNTAKPEKKDNWNAWTSSNWWQQESRPRYSDEDFEDIWRKAKERQTHYRKSTDHEYESEDKSKERGYGKKPFASGKANHYADEESRPFRRKRDKIKHSPIPEKFTVTAKDRKSQKISGEFLRIEDYNGRAAFQRIGQRMFLFWSSKFGDWKIHTKLKDENECSAFNEDVRVKNPCDIALPWFVWNHHRDRFDAEDLTIVAAVDSADYSAWSIQDLITKLQSLGLGDQAKSCLEKQELIDLLVNAGKTTTSTIQIASRARVDSASLPPPSLSPRHKVNGNRIEDFDGDDVADWITRQGQRDRYYGVFQDGEMQYGLLWDRSLSQWERVYTTHVKKPLREEDT